jgi:hypothetical protein
MLKVTTIIALLLTTIPALACGNGECDPDPEPERPSVEKTTEYDHSRPDSIQSNYYIVCTCDKFKVAWGFESLEVRTAKARMQCEQHRERISCPTKWK